MLLLLLFCSVKNLLLKDRYNLINMPDITLKLDTVILFVIDDLHDVSCMTIYPRSRPHISSLSNTTIPSAKQSVPPNTMLFLYILQKHSLPVFYVLLAYVISGSSSRWCYCHSTLLPLQCCYVGSTKSKIKSMSLWQPVRHDIHTHQVPRKSGSRSKIWCGGEKNLHTCTHKEHCALIQTALFLYEDT